MKSLTKNKTKITNTDISSCNFDEQSVYYALSDPNILRYAKRLQQIPLAYKKMLKKNNELFSKAL
jgi:hypothetical protein